MRVLLKKQNIKISVILPVYNSEKYLRDAIESIVGQSIGIDNIQLIIVDDGSDDLSASIYKAYKQKYKNNITVIKKENGGVSSARNVGIEHAIGMYTCFIDSDDKWDIYALEKAVTFFNEHYDEVDSIFCRISIFGENKYNHPLDYKYTTNYVADKREYYDYINTTIGNSIFKTKELKKYKFDENMSHYEDTLFIALFMKERDKFGICSEAIYYYRKQITTTSLSVSEIKKKDWYLKTPHKLFEPLIQETDDKKEIDRFSQYYIAYMIRWRLDKRNIQTALSQEELVYYKQIISRYLKYIDDDILLKIKGLSAITRTYLLSLKYGVNVLRIAHEQDGYLMYNKNRILNLRGRGLIELISVIKKRDTDECIIFGMTTFRIFNERCRLFCEYSDDPNGYVEVTMTDDFFFKTSFCDEVYYMKSYFVVTIPKNEMKNIFFFVTWDDKSDRIYLAVNNEVLNRHE